MISITEKIKDLIKSTGYKKPGEFYLHLKELHGPDVMDPKTFYNLLNDRIQPREKTLFQVALGLHMNTTELRHGTTLEIAPTKEDGSCGTHSYNDKATIYTYPIKAAGMPLRLALKTGGQTPEEKDPDDVKESCKIIFVTVGIMTVVIKTPSGEDRRELHSCQTTSFDARQPHYFINNSRNNSVAFIVHIPAENSGFFTP